jgi:hypothetical protein
VTFSTLRLDTISFSFVCLSIRNSRSNSRLWPDHMERRIDSWDDCHYVDSAPFDRQKVQSQVNSRMFGVFGVDDCY